MTTDLDRAAADEAFLQRKLGVRYQGVEYDEGHDDFVVTLRRADGRHVWIPRPTPEDALAAARAKVEGREDPWLSTRSTSGRAARAEPHPAPSTTPPARTQPSLW